MGEKTGSDTLKEMKIGEIRHFPKDQYRHWSHVATRLYCHGYNYKVRTRKAWDYVEVERVE